MKPALLINCLVKCSAGCAAKSSMELALLALPRLNFKAGQQRCLLRETGIFSPTSKASSEQGCSLVSHLLWLGGVPGTDFEVALSARGTAVRPQPKWL